MVFSPFDFAIDYLFLILNLGLSFFMSLFSAFLALSKFEN